MTSAEEIWGYRQRVLYSIPVRHGGGVGIVYSVYTGV